MTFLLLRMRWAACLLLVAGLGGASEHRCAEATAPRPAAEETSLRDPDSRTEKCHRKRCCAVYLPFGDDVAASNETVSVGGLSFPANESEINGTYGVTVCYPNTPKFVECLAWQRAEDEVRKDGLAIYEIATGNRIELGEYVVVNQQFWVCVPESVVQSDHIRSRLSYLFAAAYGISILSLIVTFKVQLSSKKSLTNQKIVLLSHVSSLILGYTALLTIYTLTYDNYTTCFVLGVLMHYGFLAASFWLSVLTFVHWRKFADFQSLVATSTGIRAKLFLRQCLCGWGIPLILCVVTICLHLHYTKDETRSLDNCWTQDTIILATLFYGPMGGTIVFNTIFTVMMIVNIRKSRDCIATINPNSINQKVNILRLTLKLLTIIHLYWIFEVVSWFVGDDKRYWAFLDIVNALQGFFLFVAYCCRRNTVKKVVTTFINHGKKITCKRRVAQDNVNRQNAGSVSSVHSSTSTLQTNPDI